MDYDEIIYAYIKGGDMRRSIQLFSVLISLFYFNIALADTYQGPTKLFYRIQDNITVNGPTTLNYVKVKVLAVNGDLKFDHLKVSDSAQLMGPVEGQYGEFGTCKIKGPAQLSEVKAQALNVTGVLQASRLKVAEAATVTGKLSLQEAEIGALVVTPGDNEQISLNQTQVKSIVVKGSHGSVLKLMNNSVVEGNVTFESGQGKIETDQSSKVMGHVTGAKN